MSDTNSIEALVQKLEAIAKKNDDKFRYNIEVNIERHGISYRFVAIETADSHEFVTGFGTTVEYAVKDADNNVQDACKHWSYKP